MSSDPRAKGATSRCVTWQDFAACRDRDVRIFFPEQGSASPLARAICRRCPVRDACLAEALAEPALQGIWGGTTDEQRRALRHGHGATTLHR